MSGVTAVVCATGFTPSLNFKKDNPAQVDHKGTDNLVAAATAEGSTVKKFVLVTSRAPPVTYTPRGARDATRAKAHVCTITRV